MLTHHLKFYMSYFFYYWSLNRCCGVKCVAFLATASISIKAFVFPSASPSLCEHVPSLITMVGYQMIRNTYCLWRPNFQGHMSNFKVTQAKISVKRVNFTVFGHFLENSGGKGLKFGMLMYPDHRPHSRQVIEARYTEGAARQSTVSHRTPVSRD